MPHTPQALVFPPLQRAAPSSARAAEAEHFEHAAEAIRPSWPALPKPSVARAGLARGAANQDAPGPSPFDAHRFGAEAAPSFAPRSFDAGDLEENPFKRPRKGRGWTAALLVIAAAALGWVLLRGQAPNSAATAAPSPKPPVATAAPAASAPAASAPSAPAPVEAPKPPSAAAPRTEAPAAAAQELPPQPKVAAPVETPPSQKAIRPAAQAKQPWPVSPAKSTANKPQPGKATTRPVPTRAAPIAPRPAPAQPANDSFAPRRHQSTPIQTNPYD